MPLYRFYLSASPGDPSPADSGLSSIDAGSPADAVEMLRRDGRLPKEWQSLWIRFLESGPTRRVSGAASNRFRCGR